MFRLRSLGRLLGRCGQCVGLIEAQSWEAIGEPGSTDKADDESPYVALVVADAEAAWGYLCGLGSSAASSPSLSASSSVVLPHRAREAVWTETVQAVMESLVEGFSRVGCCSPGGRSRMACDLRAVALGLDKIHRARPTRGKVSHARAKK